MSDDKSIFDQIKDVFAKPSKGLVDGIGEDTVVDLKRQSRNLFAGVFEDLGMPTEAARRVGAQMTLAALFAARAADLEDDLDELDEEADDT